MSRTERKAQKINDDERAKGGKIFLPSLEQMQAGVEVAEDLSEKSFYAELAEAMSKPVSDDPDMTGWCGTAKTGIMQMTQNQVTVYLVGGAVREIVRGFPEKIKDWDFAVEAKSYEQMRFWLKINGFEIFVETPQYMTIRARAPKGYEFAGIDMTGKTFDFALCRTDGEYSDGRHPDTVAVANLEADLSRREFTMNALAMGADGKIIDMHGGQEDIKNGLIKLVGGVERLREDPLRMLRAIRFQLQLGFELDNDIHSFLYNTNNSVLLRKVDDNRIRDELTKCFKLNTPETLMLLQIYFAIREYIFTETPLWLEPTVKGK